MIFEFLKYLQPTSYFLLKNNNGEYVFPKYDELNQEVKSQLYFDSDFETKEASKRNISWQAVNKGFTGNSTKTKNYENSITILDNYVFIRKYFSHVWVIYVLLLRILTLHNPFKEIISFYKTRKVKKINYLENPLKQDGYKNFKSNLIKSKPLVCIVIPTLNRYEYLKDVLTDLEKQTYSNFEVIIIDQSEPFLKTFYDNSTLNLKVVHQKEKALWLARNTAIKMSKSNYFLLYDDDSRVDENWVYNHMKCIDFFKADISSGVSISKIGAKTPQHYSFFRISDQLDTGNVLIKRTIFETIGLFDRQFEKQRMGDGEYGLRAYLNNYLNISNPYAKRLHLKVSSGGLRDMGSWDAFRTERLFAPRPIPSVLYLYRKYFGRKLSKLALLKTIPISIMPYRFKGNKIMMLFGAFFSLFLLPLITYQVLRSWRLSSLKLLEGSKIDTLN